MGESLLCLHVNSVFTVICMCGVLFSFFGISLILVLVFASPFLIVDRCIHPQMMSDAAHTSADDSPAEHSSMSRRFTAATRHNGSSMVINKKADKALSLTNNMHQVPMITAGMSLGGNGRATGGGAPGGGGDAAGPGAAADLLRGDMDVFDHNVYAYCQKYLSIHHSQHRQMSSEHAMLDQRRIYAIPTFRSRWNLILNLSQKTRIGRWITATEGAVVVLSILTIILESIPKYNGDVVAEYENTWFLLEFVITAYFAVLTVFRFAVSPSVASVIMNPMSWFDVVSLLPLAVQAAVQSRTYGWLKTLRLFRLVKLLRMFQYIDALVETLRRIASSLVAPFLLLAVFVVIVGNVMFWLEGGGVWTFHDAVAFLNRTNYSDAAYIYSLVNHTVINDCTCESTAAHLFGTVPCPPLVSGFLSAAHGMWYALASFTTTGYGDIVPQCAPGKVTTSIALLFSTIFIAMPIAIVGTSFAETVIDHHSKMMLHKKLKARTIRDLREASSQPPPDIMHAKKRSRNVGRAGGGAASPPRGGAPHATGPLVVTKAVSACEGLLRFVASQLHVEQLDFNVESFCVSRACDDNPDQQAEQPMRDESAPGKDDVCSSAHLTQRITSYRQLPLRAQYSAQLVDTMDAYLSWLFEYWLTECLAGNLDPTVDVLRPPDAAVCISALVSPYARRSGAEERQAAYRERRRQSREEEVNRAKAALWETIQSRVGSLHHMAMLQAVDRPPGFVKEIRLPTCSVTTVVSASVLPGAAGQRQHSEGTRGPTKRTSAFQAASSSGDSGPDGTGGNLLVLSSNELWLPDRIGTFEHFTTFATRHLVFTPHESCIDSIGINGVPLVEVAAQQHMSRIADVLDRADVAERSDVLLLVKRLRYAAVLLDAHKGLSPDHQPGRTLSAFGSSNRGGTRLATRDHLMVERVFSVSLRCGDVIDFTMDLRTHEGMQNPPIGLTSSSVRGMPEREMEASEVEQLRQRRATELEAEGIRSITYRVVQSVV